MHTRTVCTPNIYTAGPTLSSSFGNLRNASQPFHLRNIKHNTEIYILFDTDLIQLAFNYIFYQNDETK